MNSWKIITSNIPNRGNLNLPIFRGNNNICNNFETNPAIYLKHLENISIIQIINNQYDRTRKTTLQKIFWESREISNQEYNDQTDDLRQKLTGLNIYTLSNTKRKALLYFVSNILNDNQGAPIAENSTPSIEHMLPQNFNHWLNDVNNPGWTAELAQRWLHKIGNLILLPQNLNARVSDCIYSEKIAIIQNGNFNFNQYGLKPTIGPDGACPARDGVQNSDSGVRNACKSLIFNKPWL